VSAIEIRNFELMHYFIEKGIDMNKTFVKDDFYSRIEQSPLCIAIENNDFEIIKILMKKKKKNLNIGKYEYIDSRYNVCFVF
jgi:ankyrin repeat protein